MRNVSDEIIAAVNPIALEFGLGDPETDSEINGESVIYLGKTFRLVLSTGYETDVPIRITFEDPNDRKRFLLLQDVMATDSPASEVNLPNFPQNFEEPGVTFRYVVGLQPVLKRALSKLTLTDQPFIAFEDENGCLPAERESLWHRWFKKEWPRD